MSLVNDMLRDLDRRRRHPVSYQSARMALDSDGSIAGSNRKVIIIAALATLAVVAGGAMFIGGSVPGSSPQTVAVSEGVPLAQRTGSIQSGGQADSVQAPAISARIAGESNRTNGFELRLETTERVPFEVLTRTDSSVSVLLGGVSSLSNRISSLDGASVELTGDGLLLTLRMGRDTDFVVYENSNGFTYAVVIEGFWQTAPQITAAPVVENTAAPATVNDPVAADPTGAATPPATARTDTAGADNWGAAPVRTQREPSLQDRDRNASQQALRLVQNGQMQSAYESLYDFIGEYPQAHQSRNTLITLLYAQQQYGQVDVLVEEGLSLAPNLSLYKKMKARLLMMDGNYQQAMILLRNVPPAVSEDKEYHELLASLYQQTGDYSAAIATYQELIRTDNNVGRWWAGMGISHESLGNTREAVSSFEVALQVPGLENNLRQYSRNRIKSLSGQ